MFKINFLIYLHYLKYAIENSIDKRVYIKTNEIRTVKGAGIF